MHEKHDLDVAGEVKDIVIRTLELGLTRDQLTDDTRLYSSVVRMDSLMLLRLIVAVERDLGIEIDDEDVMNTDLRDVGSLVTMVLGAARGDRDVARAGDTAGQGSGHG